MGYEAAALITLGSVIGLLFGLRILFFAVGVLLFCSVGVSLIQHLNLLESVTTILVAQAILQGSFFLASLLKTAIKEVRSRRSML
jgi:hypothetical protein